MIFHIVLNILRWSNFEPRVLRENSTCSSPIKVDRVVETDDFTTCYEIDSTIVANALS